VGIQKTQLYLFADVWLPPGGQTFTTPPGLRKLSTNPVSEPVCGTQLHVLQSVWFPLSQEISPVLLLIC
jgi:hypothetical protein